MLVDSIKKQQYKFDSLSFCFDNWVGVMKMIVSTYFREAVLAYI